MNKFIFIFSLFFGVLMFKNVRAQKDTIYFHNGQIEAATITRVSNNMVGFRYLNEDADRIAGFDAIKKIVYRSGRNEDFSSKRDIPTETNTEPIKFLRNKTDAEGLREIAEISAHTRFINLHTSSSGARAARNKLLKKTAALGCPFIFIEDDKEVMYGQFKFWGVTQHTYKAVVYTY